MVQCPFNISYISAECLQDCGDGKENWHNMEFIGRSFISFDMIKYMKDYFGEVYEKISFTIKNNLLC